jgi:hypothetical protein
MPAPAPELPAIIKACLSQDRWERGVGAALSAYRGWSYIGCATGATDLCAVTACVRGFGGALSAGLTYPKTTAPRMNAPTNAPAMAILVFKAFTSFGPSSCQPRPISSAPQHFRWQGRCQRVPATALRQMFFTINKICPRLGVNCLTRWRAPTGNLYIHRVIRMGRYPDTESDLRNGNGKLPEPRARPNRRGGDRPTHVRRVQPERTKVRPWASA